MPLAWQFRNLKIVVKSNLTGETLALQEAIVINNDQMYVFRDIIKQLHNQTLPIKCITDSKSLRDVVYLSKEVTEKRLKIELLAIRESLEKGEIESVL